MSAAPRVLPACSPPSGRGWWCLKSGTNAWGLGARDPSSSRPFICDHTRPRCIMPTCSSLASRFNPWLTQKQPARPTQPRRCGWH